MPYSNEFDQYKPTRVIYLTKTDAEHLGKWLRIIPRPPDFNRGRWEFLSTPPWKSGYITVRELAILMDSAFPVGLASDIIRGQVFISEVKQEMEDLDVPVDGDEDELRLMEEDRGNDPELS